LFDLTRPHPAGRPPHPSHRRRSTCPFWSNIQYVCPEEGQVICTVKLTVTSVLFHPFIRRVLAVTVGRLAMLTMAAEAPSTSHELSRLVAFGGQP
jgi:hypothetical protein